MRENSKVNVPTLHGSQHLQDPSSATRTCGNEGRLPSFLAFNPGLRDALMKWHSKTYPQNTGSSMIFFVDTHCINKHIGHTCHHKYVRVHNINIRILTWTSWISLNFHLHSKLTPPGLAASSTVSGLGMTSPITQVSNVPVPSLRNMWACCCMVCDMNDELDLISNE